MATSYEKWLKGGGAKDQPPTTYKEWLKNQPVKKASKKKKSKLKVT